MWVRAYFAILLLVLPTTALAQTEKRTALLIGNKDYKAGVGMLTNPLNDIRIASHALKSVRNRSSEARPERDAPGDAARQP